MNNKNTSQKVSFLQLISDDSIKCNCCDNTVWKPIKKVEIPIIQRDYAQGRDGKDELRKNFLNSLLKAIEDKPLELDFVYGNIVDDVLQPLDGQQRLTTLYLLYWFVAVKENKLDEDLKNLLNKFTYETRTSSSEFCEELINKGIRYSNETKISDVIIDSSWFFLSWKKDPTIKSMLTMLDAIQQIFKDKTEVWEKLENITFHFIELQNFGLSDDLYIKMNARGKPLTEFENFKAKFEQYYKLEIFKTDENGKEILENGQKVILKGNWEKELSLTDENKAQWKLLTEKSFAYKIDTQWTDLFWINGYKNNKIDDKLMKFIAGIAINNYAICGNIYEDLEQDNIVIGELKKKNSKYTNAQAIKRERVERRIQVLFNNPKNIIPEDFPTKDSFQYLIDCFDIFSKDSNHNIIALKLPLWDFITIENNGISSENNLFSELIKPSKTEYKQRVLFYAQSAYLLKSEEKDDELFSEWMRVVRNIAQNSTIDSASTFIGAIGLINELSAGCANIYEYLRTNDIVSQFAQTQIKEEKLKSFANKNSENKRVIFQLEDTIFFKGKIEFALHCSDFKNSESKFEIQQLNSILSIVNEHLAQKDLSNSFRRGLLTCGENDFYKYWTSWSYNTELHKRCFLENVNELKNNLSKEFIRENLKELFLKMMNQTLEQVIETFVAPIGMPNWKKEIIKKPELLNNYCQGHFFGILDLDESDDRCFLFNSKKRPNSRSECHEVL